MLYWISSLRIYSVSILSATFVIEVTVVTTCSHSLVSNIYDSLQLIVYTQRIICWLCHSDSPREPIRINTRCNDLTTYLHHEVLDAKTTKKICNHIHTISLSNS